MKFMIERFYHYHQSTSMRMFPELIQYINSFDSQLNQFTKRVLDAPVTMSNGVQFLKYILDTCDVPYIVRQSENDFYSFTTYIKDIYNKVENIFDPIRSNKLYYNYFIKYNGKKCNELIIPVGDIDHLKTLQFGVDYYSGWEYEHPVTLWYHDSDEYTLDLLNTQLKFHRDIPSYCIIFVDPVSLCMKYFKYATSSGTNTINTLSFIKNKILIKLLKQNRNIWMFKTHMKCLESALTDDYTFIEKNKPYMISQYGSIGGRYPYIMEDIIQYYKGVIHNTYTMNSIFNSKLFPDEKSFNDIVETYKEEIDVEHLTQYRWLRVVRDLPYLKYLCLVYKLRKNQSEYDNFRYILGIEIRRLESSGVLSNIKLPFFKNMVNSQIDEIKKLMEI